MFLRLGRESCIHVVFVIRDSLEESHEAPILLEQWRFQMETLAPLQRSADFENAHLCNFFKSHVPLSF